VKNADQLRFREIEPLLADQLLKANEAYRIAKMLGRPRSEQDVVLEAAQTAFKRWYAFVVEARLRRQKTSSRRGPPARRDFFEVPKEPPLPRGTKNV
jgi:hypothetical protein